MQFTSQTDGISLIAAAINISLLILEGAHTHTVYRSIFAQGISSGQTGTCYISGGSLSVDIITQLIMADFDQ